MNVSASMSNYAMFRKSSYSTGNAAECVEIANALDAVRDSKNPGGGLLRGNVMSLVAEIKSGRFDSAR